MTDTASEDALACPPMDLGDRASLVLSPTCIRQGFQVVDSHLPASPPLGSDRTEFIAGGNGGMKGVHSARQGVGCECE
ncbi:hypothetical protein GJ744_003050 [Endocarpon pusillum]|uniref:Uncharacterized protein n=1 Tax=Endocarpon pusillum TaxID=364733 RepID=A0A8H7A795_9EURO|nr:hypothetical protein GJ744_003050 [Endocarpon pusillum]